MQECPNMFGKDMPIWCAHASLDQNSIIVHKVINQNTMYRNGAFYIINKSQKFYKNNHLK